jgi:hypothetical protein
MLATAGADKDDVDSEVFSVEGNRGRFGCNLKSIFIAY